MYSATVRARPSESICSWGTSANRGLGQMRANSPSTFSCRGDALLPCQASYRACRRETSCCGADSSIPGLSGQPSGALRTSASVVVPSPFRARSPSHQIGDQAIQHAPQRLSHRSRGRALGILGQWHRGMRGKASPPRALAPAGELRSRARRRGPPSGRRSRRPGRSVGLRAAAAGRGSIRPVRGAAPAE